MSGELILLVDDEPNILQLSRLYLEREEFRFESVGDGLEALSAVKRFHPDLVILDIMIPQVDGLEVCRELRAENNSTPVLFLTARDEDIDKILGLELCADDYLTKPFNPQEMVSRVKAIFGRTRSVEKPPDTALQVWEVVWVSLSVEKSSRHMVDRSQQELISKLSNPKFLLQR